MLNFIGSKHYSIWSYRTPDMDTTLERGQAVHYRSDPRTIVFRQI